MRISVVMATFNGEAYVAEQITSILQGSRPPDEFIVVDDASTDNTVAIIEHLIQDRPSVDLTILRNARNEGPTRAFVSGSLRSTGDVVFFADQDDRWHPDKIDRMARAFLEDPKLVMAYCDGVITNAHLDPTDRTIFSTRRHRDLHRGTDRDPLKIAVNPDVKGCTMAVNGPWVRALLQQGTPSFGKLWGHDHWIALFAFGTGRVHVFQEPLLFHRMHGANTSAGARFNLFSSADRRKWLHMARTQQVDHLSSRYRVALEHIEQCKPDFAPELEDAVQRLLELSIQREALRQMPLLRRLRTAWGIHRSGVYTTLYNGWSTLLRDALL